MIKTTKEINSALDNSSNSPLSIVSGNTSDSGSDSVSNIDTLDNKPKNRHVPVLITEIVKYLESSISNREAHQEAITVFDGTFGGGGYFEHIKNWFIDQPLNTLGDSPQKSNTKNNYKTKPVHNPDPTQTSDIHSSQINVPQTNTTQTESSQMHYLGCDLDPIAIKNAYQAFGNYAVLENEMDKGAENSSNKSTQNKDTQAKKTKSKKIQLKLVQANFVDALSGFEDGSLDYIILDLGFCTNQFDYNRGFSYGPGKNQDKTALAESSEKNSGENSEIVSEISFEIESEVNFEVNSEVNGGENSQENTEVLDLRFDPQNGLSASQKIRLSSPKELSKVIYTYSGEELARRIADRVFEKMLEKDKLIASEIIDAKSKKQEKNITTAEFRSWIQEAIPAKYKKNTNKILSRVWQAIRIWVNGEMESLGKFLEIAPTKLKHGGLLMIVDFHSLEDKLITKHFRELGKQYTDDFGNQSWNYKLLTRRPILPSPEEIEQNPASRSASLRVLERV